MQSSVWLTRTQITGWIDQGLNEKAYIIPGLGDFGERRSVGPAQLHVYLRSHAPPQILPVSSHTNEAVVSVLADDASRAAFGPDVLDPASMPASAREGRRQGREAAAVVAAAWTR